MKCSGRYSFDSFSQFNAFKRCAFEDIDAFAAEGFCRDPYMFYICVHEYVCFEQINLIIQDDLRKLCAIIKCIITYCAQILRHYDACYIGGSECFFADFGYIFAVNGVGNDHLGGVADVFVDAYRAVFNNRVFEICFRVRGRL